MLPPFLLGLAFGAVMLLSAFSFAGAFRRFLTDRRSAGVRAQFLMIAATTLLILPATTAGTLFGTPVRGLIFPPGTAIVVGAFLFGTGMQLGGGCASGTLYATGGGSLRALLTLAFFVIGATLASWQSELWQHWPAPPPLALAETFGLLPALLGTVTLLAAAAWLTWHLERRRHGTAEPIRRPLLWAALALAALNFLTLPIAGRPWAITAAFPLWGAKTVAALGLDEPAFWPFWEDPTRIEALLRPLSADRMTAMDFGMIAGAFLAATVAGKFALGRLTQGEAAASTIGGLLLGIGAVLASGCNISAYVSGIASGSLHSWLWIAPALFGNWLGLHLRPAFGIREV